MTEECDSGDEYAWEGMNNGIPYGGATYADKLSPPHLLTVILILLTILPVIRVLSLLALRVRCHPLLHLWPAR